MVKKTKKSSLLLTVGAAALLVAGGGVAYWILTQRGFGSGELPIGAEVIPQDALMTISVSTDPGQWLKLREFGTAQSQAALDQNLANARDRILTANGFNYDRDIKPWIGKEATVAFLSPQASPPPSGANPVPPVPQAQQATILVLPIQDAGKAKDTLEKFKPQSGKVSDRIYKGVQIRETQGTASQNYSATVLDQKLVVVTNDMKAMDRAIDTYKGEASLAATPGYAQALGKVQAAAPFGKLYVNLPIWAANISATSGKPVPPQILALVQQAQGLAAAVTLEPEGIRFKSVSWLKPDSQRKYHVSNTAKDIATRLPADTFLTVSGGNLKQLWQDYSQVAVASPGSPVNPDWLRKGLQSTIGMDLDQDFLNWMDGEFSLSLVPTAESNSVGLPNFVFMVHANDRRAAEDAFKRLDEAMATKYKFKVEESRVGDLPVTNWSRPDISPTITHGWLDGDVAFLALGTPIAKSFIPKPTTSLADSDIFKAATSSDLQPNNGHYFANVEYAVKSKNPLLLPLVQSLLPLPLESQLMSAIRSVGVTAAVSDERTTRYDVFALLQKAGAPKPLPSPKLPSLPPAASPSPQ
jgi:hypothetical protein